MSQRIFVNTQNTKYKEITQNGKGGQLGLGVSTEIERETQISLGQLPNEVYFSSDDLREKKRKVQVLYDSFIDPKFFADGSVDIEKVQKYVTDLQLQRAYANSAELGIFGAQTVTAAATAAGTLTAAGTIAGAASATSATIGTIASATLSSALLPGIGIAVLGTLNLIKSFRQAGREDNKASWKMTRRDFPNITGQAIQGASNRRSIERLYDDRGGIKTFNVSTAEAIALLVRETLADALFCISNGTSNAITTQEHPGPGGNGNSDKWKNKEALKRHFPFKHVNSGPDRNERTYVNALLYLRSYISLIDDILNLQQPSLSRTPDTEQAQIRLPLEIRLSTATVKLFDALTDSARQVVREKVLTFFDENREYKTLLNFGSDRQYVAEAWRLAPSDTGSVQLKLLRPLESDIVVESEAFIGRELAQTVIDTVDFNLLPPRDNTPYLRPFNMDSKNYVDTKMLSTNATLVTLGLSTGSVGTIIDGTTVSYEDAVFRKWFTGDFKSSELNVEFTDYNKFVHFGSAYKRLEAFNQKLITIDELTSASISSSVSSSIVSLMRKAQQKEYIIRNFDPYEQFLYYAPTESFAYSASAPYSEFEVEYHSPGTWPKKLDGTVYSPYSTTAINWLTTQLEIAQRYDDNNSNYLVSSLPTHIREDIQSEEFIRLVSMIGHLIDNVKVYIDQFPYIYSTNPDPFKELTMDQVYEVAKSFGLELPNVYALENLQSFNAQYTGDTGSRSYVAETWKRFLHSMVYFGKTKGSRTSLDALLNTYGINSPVLQIKETSYPSAGNYIQSDELTYGLKFSGSLASRIALPLVSSSLTGSTLQLSFNPIIRQKSTLLTANGWALDLAPHPSASTSVYLTGSLNRDVKEVILKGINKSSYGRIEIVSGSSRTLIASSSYFPLFSEDYTNLMLRSESGDFTVIQSDGDQILFQESASVSWGSLWNNTTNLFVGGSGSLKLGTNFDGIVDEIRVWGENISDADFVAQAYDPGSFYASTYTSAYTDLFVHVPFSQPLTSITASVLNESPYQNVAIVQTLPATGFTTASYIRVLRSIKQFTPIVGSTVYTNKNITVAPPPQFNQQFIDGNGTKVLNSRTSIKKVEEKQYDSGQNIVSFAVSPTDFTNQNIIRSMGTVDVNNIIGSPRYITGSGYSNLQSIQKDYIEYFNKTVNPNEYIRFFKDLTQGPDEMAENMIPARAKLMHGIVIESSVLSRNKDNLIRTVAVDGSATKTFNNFVAGSGSIGVGAYDFEMTESINLLPNTLGDTLPITAEIDITDSVDMKESTKSSKLPKFKQVIQKVGESYVTSSIMDNESTYSTLEADSIDAGLRVDVVSTGYPRNSYVGIPASGSIPKRIDSEDNTLIPFYDIPPRADFSDVGTYTYFHKESGVYSYDVYTLYKQPYITKLDTNLSSPISQLYAPITLLPTSSVSLDYGRSTSTIPGEIYPANSRTFGVIKAANLFTLYGIDGPLGLRLRMYRSPDNQTTDINRNFYSIPTGSHGVLFDGLLNGATDVFPYTIIQTLDSLIYYTIDNLTNTSITTASGIKLDYFSYEPDNLIPSGYLPRHYKFSRDNTTALKRRNYLGCRDVGRTFDKQPPFKVFISTQNTVVVNSAQAPSPSGEGTPVLIPEQSDTIGFGGGGRLNIE